MGQLLGLGVPRRRRRFEFTSEVGDAVDYWFVYGGDPAGCVRGYRALTGAASMLPKWAFGFWQSRERYKSFDELTRVVSEYRRRHIPIDIIVQDWEYWGEKPRWNALQWDSVRYPNPGGRRRPPARGVRRAAAGVGVAGIRPRNGRVPRSGGRRSAVRRTDVGRLQGLRRLRPRGATSSGATSARGSSTPASTAGGWTPPNPRSARDSPNASRRPGPNRPEKPIWELSTAI